MKQFLSILLFVVSAISCSRHSEYWKTFSDVESYIEMRPDSALNVLRTISPDNLMGKEEKAKHALLLSMAMDKSYIDTTDFSVLQPAIDFYSKKGTATDKLRTFYYQGRIFDNQGDLASAIMSYKRALKEGELSKDTLSHARTHVALGKMYQSLYQYEEFINENIKASELFKLTEEWNSYYNCLFRILSGSIILKDTDLSNIFGIIS